MPIAFSGLASQGWVYLGLPPQATRWVMPMAFPGLVLLGVDTPVDKMGHAYGIPGLASQGWVYLGLPPQATRWVMPMAFPGLVLLGVDTPVDKMGHAYGIPGLASQGWVFLGLPPQATRWVMPMAFPGLVSKGFNIMGYAYSILRVGFSGLGLFRVDTPGNQMGHADGIPRVGTQATI